MLQEFRQRGAADFAVGSGVIDDVGARGAIKLAGSEIDHGVERHCRPELTVQQDITGLCLIDLFAKEMCIEMDERFGIGELGECTVGGVGRRILSGADAEKIGAERG